MSNTLDVVIGVLAGGAVTYTVQVLVERHKVSIENRGALLRLSAELEWLNAACCSLLASARSTENRPASFAYVRPRWDDSPEVTPAIHTLSRFGEHLASDSRWIPVTPRKVRSVLLGLPQRLGVLLHQVTELDRELSKPENGPKLVGDVGGLIHQVSLSDSIDELFRSTLPDVVSDCTSAINAITQRISDIRTPLLEQEDE